MATLVHQKVLVDIHAQGGPAAAKAVAGVNDGFRHMGDNAANAARGFSQAQRGLGGFVGAYAGAAATFFALQQAFSALRESAKLEQSLAGTKTLAASIGQSGDVLLNTIQKITKGQLTLRDAAESANLALASGFNTDQIEKLTSIATKASRALGRDLGDSFIRLVRGTAKLEPELLDELGIFTRIEPAVQAYAQAMGKTEKFLTNFERRQAFANAVAEEGARKYAMIGTSSESSVSSLERLTASLVNLGQTLTAVLAGGLAPIAEFISGSFANSFATIGLIASLAFSKLFQVMTTGLHSATQRLSTFNDFAQAKIKSWGGVNPAVLRALQSDAAEYDIKGKGAPTGAGKFVETLRSGNFKASDVSSLRSTLITAKAASDKEIADILARSKQDPTAIQRGLSTLNGLSLKDTKEALNFNYGMATSGRGSTPGTLQQKELDALTKAVQAAAPNAAMLDSINKYNEAQGKTSKGISNIITGMQVFGTTAINVFDKITTGLSRFLFWFSIIELTWSTISKVFNLDNVFDNILKNVSEFGKSLLGLTKDAESLKKSLSDIADVSLTKQFKNQNLKETDKFSFMKSFLGIGYESEQDQASLQKTLQETITKAYASMNSSVDMESGTLLKQMDKSFIKGNFAETISRQIDEVSKMAPATFEAARAQQALINALKELKDIGPGAYGVLKNLNSQFGVSAQQFMKSFNPRDLQMSENATSLGFKGRLGQDMSLSMFSDAGLAAQRKKIEDSTPKLVDWTSGSYKHMIPDSKAISENNSKLLKVNELTSSALSVKAFQDGINEYMNNKNVNADGLSQMTAGLDNVIARARVLADLEKDEDAMQRWGKEITGAKEFLAVQELILEKTRRRIESTQYQLTLGTQLAKTFQAEINNANEFSGHLNPDGTLATDAKDMRTNMLKNLNKVIDTGRAKGADGAAVANAGIAENVLKGLYIKTSQEIKRINIELTKDLTQAMLDVYLTNGNLYKAQENHIIQTNQIVLNEMKATFDYDMQILDIESQIADVRAKSAVAALQNQINRLNATKAILDEEKNALEIDLKRKNLAADMANLKKNSGLTMLDAVNDQFGNLFSDTTKGNIKVALEVSNLDKMIASIDKEIETAAKTSAIREEQLNIEASIAKKTFEIAAVQGAAEQARLDIEIQKIKEAQLLADKEQASRLAIIRSQENIAIKEAEMQRAKIDSDLKLREAETAIMKERVNLLAEEAKILNAHVDKLAELFANTIAYQEYNSPDESPNSIIQDAKNRNDIGTIRDYLKDQVRGGIKNVDTGAAAALETLDKTQAAHAEIAKTDKARVEQELTTKRAQFAAEEKAYNTQIERQAILADKQIDYLTKQKALAGAGVDDARRTYEETLKLIEKKKESNTSELRYLEEKALYDKADLDNQRARAIKIAQLSNDPLFKFANDSIGIIKENMTKGLQDLNTAFVEGTLTWENFGEGAKDWAKKLVTDVQSALINRTVIEPITNFVQDTLGNLVTGMFDIGASPARPMYVWDVGPGGGTTGIPSAGAGLGGLLGGVGDWFSGLFSSSSSGVMSDAFANSLVLNSGGSVKRMASGGMYGRDTVPAWLEPGEFVMRKSAVDQHGLQNMQKMNNGGSAAPDITVNMHSNGTPQQMDSKPQMKFDGEKWVIDIITKDFSNNGPIRQSMRGAQF